MESVEELCDNITLIDKAKTILEGSVHEIRSKWAANEYDLVFKGDVNIEGNGQYNILNSRRKYNTVFRLKTTSEIKTNDILQTAIKFGNYIFQPGSSLYE